MRTPLAGRSLCWKARSPTRKVTTWRRLSPITGYGGKASRRNNPSPDRLTRVQFGDGLKEDIAVLLQLGGTNAADFTQLFDCAGPALEHFEQGGVVENHIGRHTLLVCQFLAAGPQGVPASVVGDLVSDILPAGATAG